MIVRMGSGVSSILQQNSSWMRSSESVNHYTTTGALQGLSKTEIAKMWGTTPAYVSKWFATYGPKMEQVVEHHLRSASSIPTKVAMRFLAVSL